MKKRIEDAVRQRDGVWPFEPGLHNLLYIDKGRFHPLCSRAEFEECTRRLRNEPSWKDAPDWAVAKAQDSAGEWYWYEVVPRPNTAMFKGLPGKSKYAGDGEVIGGWHNTLRLRPEEKKVAEKKCQGKNCGAIDGVSHSHECVAEHEEVVAANVGNAHPEAKIAGYKGQPVKQNYSPGEFAAWEEGRKARINPTHNEDKNDWYERGEFPPVGTVCRLRFATTADVVVTITYVGDGVLCYRNEKGMEYTAASDHVELRPPQNERERLIEEAQKLFIESDGGILMNDVAAINVLYNAGMLKMPEDK